MLPIPGTVAPELRSQCDAAPPPPAVARLRRIDSKQPMGTVQSVHPRRLPNGPAGGEPIMRELASKPVSPSSPNVRDTFDAGGYHDP